MPPVHHARILHIWDNDLCLLPLSLVLCLISQYQCVGAAYEATQRALPENSLQCARRRLVEWSAFPMAVQHREPQPGWFRCGPWRRYRWDPGSRLL